MNSDKKVVQPAVSSQQGKEWVRSKEGQEALEHARMRAKAAVKKLEARDRSLSQLVRQKTTRSL